MDDVLHEFLDEARAHLLVAGEAVERLRASPDEAARLALFRRLHTLKGTAAFLPLPRIAALAHLAETLVERLARVPSPAADAGAVAAVLARLDEVLRGIAPDGAEPDGDDAGLLALAGPDHRGPLPLLAEMAAAAERLADVAGLQGCAHLASRRLLAAADALARDLLEARPGPLPPAFAHLPGLVRGLEAALAKPLRLVIEGAAVELSAEAARALRDALPHLVRNAADHGIEPPARRVALGKPERGLILVRAELDSDAVRVTVHDDGAGLDREAVMRAAGPDASGSLDPEAVARLVFTTGLSTAAQVTAISGRGIGLDAARAGVEAAGGTLALRSEPGQGTTLTLRLPCVRRPAHPLPSLARSA